MPQVLKIGVAQARTLSSTEETLASLSFIARKAAQINVDLVLFPEAFIGGYPRSCNFGTAVGSRNDLGKEQFLEYFHSAVDLGDTPEGAGDAWIDRKLPLAKDATYRGDGTREKLEQIAQETGVFLCTGIIERSGGSLYCAVLYICPRDGVIGKRRKVMPTGTERLIWAQGSPSTLRAVMTRIKGVKLTLAAAVCWENLMPLLRQSLYSQNVNLWLAPTADARDTWAPLMQTIAFEGRVFVLSANQCVRRKQLPAWITRSNDKFQNENLQKLNSPEAVTSPVKSSGHRRTSVVSKTEEGHEISWPLSPGLRQTSSTATQPGGDPSYFEESAIGDVGSEKHEVVLPRLSASRSAATVADDEGNEFVCRGGSCIVSPNGQILRGPLWEKDDDTLLTAQVDFEDCERGRLDLDVAGSYSRNDSFKLTVQGLDLSPPP